MVQTCSVCNNQSPDFAKYCLSCNVDLFEFSITAVARKKFQDNPRVANIRLLVSSDACPICASHEGTYSKENAPPLPVEACSHKNGCRCFYEPMLTEIYP